MRSRFSAFRLGDVDHLLRSWHPDTRPDALDLDQEQQWRALQIVTTRAGSPVDETGVVEFRASYRTPAGAGLLHEVSRFRRHDGRWLYLDGDLLGD